MIKRLNLYFNLQREQDRIVYEKISFIERNVKSAFVIETIYKTLIQAEKLDKEIIKQAMREVLKELEIKRVEEVETEEAQIPDEVFEVLAKL